MKSVARKNKRKLYDKYIMASWGRSASSRMKRDIRDKQTFKKVKDLYE